MNNSDMLLILLGLPVASAVVLAFVGDRKFAPEINISGSAATFIAGIALATSLWTIGTFFFLWYWARRLLSDVSSIAA